MAALLAVAMVPDGAWAEDEAKEPPQLEVDLLLEVQDEWIYDSDDPDAQTNTLSGKIESGLILRLTPWLGASTILVFEPVEDGAGGEGRYFEDHGLYAETLNLFVELDPVTVRGGKFNPDFGIAWGEVPKLFGDDFADDYELTERVGVAGSVEFGSEQTGAYSASAAAFFRDTSALSGSLITRRERLDGRDGGLGNTEDLSSFAIALDAEDLPFAPDVALHAALLRQAAGRGDAADQTAFALAALYTAEIGHDLSIEPLAEWVHSEDGLFDEEVGIDGAEQDYVTISLGLRYRSWAAALTHSLRETSVPGSDGDSSDRIWTALVGYRFPHGIEFDLAWGRVEEDGVVSHGLGTRLSWDLEF